MLLDQLQPVLLGEQHEPVHRPLGLVRVLDSLLGRGHRGRHDGAGTSGGPDGRGEEVRYAVSESQTSQVPPSSRGKLVR